MCWPWLRPRARDDHVLQVKDGNIVIGSSQTLIQGLAQEARVTKANEQGLVLGFEVQDGPKSMVDIVLGKVSSLLVPTASIHCAPFVLADALVASLVFMSVSKLLQRCRPLDLIISLTTAFHNYTAKLTDQSLLCSAAHLPEIPGVRALQAVVDDPGVGQQSSPYTA